VLLSMALYVQGSASGRICIGIYESYAWKVFTHRCPTIQWFVFLFIISLTSAELIFWEKLLTLFVKATDGWQTSSALPSQRFLSKANQSCFFFFTFKKTLTLHLLSIKKVFCYFEIWCSTM